jgi:hypothetical protein
MLHRLKTDYHKHKRSLGETGFGIVVEDREEELYGDPQNVWGVSLSVRFQ